MPAVGHSYSRYTTYMWCKLLKAFQCQSTPPFLFMHIYSVGSQCTECSLLNILWYILLQYLPTTLLFTIIYTLHVSFTSAPTVFYILHCNVYIFIFKMDTGLYFVYLNYVPIFLRTLGKIQLTLCGIWTLDFFCFVFPPSSVAKSSYHNKEMKSNGS